MFPERIYFEPQALNYELGQQLYQKYSCLPWVAIQSHNSIPELQASPNQDFGRMKRYLVIGLRKTHKYVPNHKVSDFLVPYTSSGCSASCLYCYLVCNYNKCSYLRLFVNREQMLAKLIKTAAAAQSDLTFEIGSNSDLVLENTITGNLPWTIESFGQKEKGFLTFPTKFDMIDPLLGLDHRARTIIRMSMNPKEVIRKVEFGTSPLPARIDALNRLAQDGYPVGILIAPVVLLANWQSHYQQLIQQLADTLSPQSKQKLFIEIIFMTYSFVHRVINNDAFPNAVELYDKALMTGRGRGRYCYRPDVRAEAEAFLRQELQVKLPSVPILYVV